MQIEIEIIVALIAGSGILLGVLASNWSSIRSKEIE